MHPIEIEGCDSATFFCFLCEENQDKKNYEEHDQEPYHHDLALCAGLLHHHSDLFLHKKMLFPTLLVPYKKQKSNNKIFLSTTNQLYQNYIKVEGNQIPPISNLKSS